MGIAPTTSCSLEAFSASAFPCYDRWIPLDLARFHMSGRDSCGIHSIFVQDAVFSNMFPAKFYDVKNAGFWLKKCYNNINASLECFITFGDIFYGKLSTTDSGIGISPPTIRAADIRPSAANLIHPPDKLPTCDHHHAETLRPTALRCVQARKRG